MSKTKKIFVCVLTAVIAVAICVSFAACGDDRIVELERRIDALEEQLNAKEDSEIPVYKLGDTFTYVSAGIPLFSVKVTKNTEYGGYDVTAKNINMPSTPPSYFVVIRYDNHSGTLGNTALVIGAEKTSSFSFSAVTQIYVGLPISGSDYIIPYCIFKLV